MKKVLFSLFMLGAATASFAQTNATIQQLQNVNAANLAACEDSSSYKGQTVTTKGVVVMNVGLAQVSGGNNIWLQSGTGPFSGIDVFGSSASTILDGFLAGDSVEITGTMAEFSHETELTNITAVTLITAGNTVKSNLVNLGDINSTTQVNIPTTGEQWEGLLSNCKT